MLMEHACGDAAFGLTFDGIRDQSHQCPVSSHNTCTTHPTRHSSVSPLPPLVSPGVTSPCSYLNSSFGFPVTKSPVNALSMMLGQSENEARQNEPV